MLNLYVVGCGGIGGYLINLLPMAIASLSLDMLSEGGTIDIQPFLDEAGTLSIPLICDRITLIDGDTFNARNSLRQGEGVGSKLTQRIRSLVDKRNSVLLGSWARRLDIQGWPVYINPDNMNKIIPHEPEPNNENHCTSDMFRRCRVRFGTFDMPVVFLCVDNKKTRYEISKYMETFSDCIVINGGNDRTTGHVTIYQRKGGRELDPNLYEMYPGVTATADKRPDEVACGTVAPKHDQIANTNAIIANWMSVVFNNLIRWGENNYKGNRRVNEILIDTDGYTTMAIYHEPKTKEENNGEEDQNRDQ